MINAGTVGAYLTLDINDFKTNLTTAGQMLESFRREHSDSNGLGGQIGTAVFGALSGAAVAAAKSIGTLNSAMGALPEKLRGRTRDAWQAMKEELTGGGQRLFASAWDIGGGIVGAVNQSLDSSNGGLQGAGRKAAGSLCDGLQSKVPAAVTAAKGIMQSMSAASGTVSFAGIGRSVVSGIVKGMNEKIPGLMKKAASLASGIAATIKGALVINSPSKIMIPMGQAVAEGMEVGLSQGAEGLYRTASAISLETAETLGDISKRGLPYAAVQSAGYGSRLDRLDKILDAVEKLADSQTTMEIDGRSFGRMVREYV